MQNGTKNIESWDCEKCGAALVYKVKKDKASFRSINKQKAKARFVSLEATCQSCNHYQEIKSGILLRLYNEGFNDGLAFAKEISPELLNTIDKLEAMDDDFGLLTGSVDNDLTGG